MGLYGSKSALFQQFNAILTGVVALVTLFSTSNVLAGPSNIQKAVFYCNRLCTYMIGICENGSGGNPTPARRTTKGGAFGWRI